MPSHLLEERHRVPKRIICEGGVLLRIVESIPVRWRWPGGVPLNMPKGLVGGLSPVHSMNDPGGSTTIPKRGDAHIF